MKTLLTKEQALGLARILQAAQDVADLAHDGDAFVLKAAIARLDKALASTAALPKNLEPECQVTK